MVSWGPAEPEPVAPRRRRDQVVSWDPIVEAFEYVPEPAPGARERGLDRDQMVGWGPAEPDPKPATKHYHTDSRGRRFVYYY